MKYRDYSSQLQENIIPTAKLIDKKGREGKRFFVGDSRSISGHMESKLNKSDSQFEDARHESSMFGAKLDVVIFWFMNDWGRYGRAYEKIAENLSLLDEVRRIICLLPLTEPAFFLWPVRPRFVSDKLCVVTLRDVVRPSGRPYRIREMVNRTVTELALSNFARRLGLEKREDCSVDISATSIYWQANRRDSASSPGYPNSGQQCLSGKCG